MPNHLSVLQQVEAVRLATIVPIRRLCNVEWSTTYVYL